MRLKQVVSVGLSMLLAQAMALPQPYLQNGILLSTRDDTVAAQPAQDKAQHQPQQNGAAQPGIDDFVGSFLGGGAGGGGSGFSMPSHSSPSGMASGGTQPSSSSPQSFFGGLTGLVDAASKLKPADKPDNSWQDYIDAWKKASEDKKSDDEDAYTKWYKDYQKQWEDYNKKLDGKKDDDDDDDDGGSITASTLSFKIKDLKFNCNYNVPYPGNTLLNCNYQST